MKKCLLPFVAIIFFSCGNDNDKVNESNSAKTEAVKDLSEKVKQNPDSAGLRMQLINSLDSLKQYKTAIAHADSLILKDSMNEGLWLTKAHLEENNGDTANAIKSYERAIKIYPAVEAQLYLANLFAETKNIKALWLCTNVLRMGLGRENDASSNFIAGVYFARTGNTKKAIDNFDKAITDNYTLMEAYMEKGFIMYDSRQYVAALKIFETASSVNASYADAWYWKAKCHEALGNKPEAIKCYRQALKYDKDLKEAGEGLARLGVSPPKKT